MKQVIVITGASSGFGELTAHELAKAGHVVYASMRETKGRNAPQVETAKKFAVENKVDLRTIELDVGYALCSRQQRQIAVLARVALQGALGTGGQGNRNRRPFRLAHIPPHVRDAPQRERRRREGCARANAACKHLGHFEHLRASDHPNQARCAESSCELVARQKRRKTKPRGLSDVNGPTKLLSGFASG